MRTLSLLMLIASVQSSLSYQQAPSTQTECFELPVVIVSAVDRSFPNSSCHQLRYPAEDCLKEAVKTRVEVIDNVDGKLNCINGERTAVFEHSKANYRGQTSLYFRKHQFNLKFPEDTSFLGLVKNKAFVMNGPFLDCTLQRNHLAQWLYRSTGRYAVKTRHTVVYMRTSPSQQDPKYAGIFLLLEKPTYDKNHVNLAELNASCAARNPKAMSGGWAWSNDPPSYGSYSPNMVIDQYQNEFGMGERPILAYPEGSSLSQQMRDFFVNINTGFLPQMYRVLWYNMTAPHELEKHLDLGSYADYLLHTEMSLNVDAYRRSTFFFKDRDQTINAGPVWDLNLAYGNGARRNFKDWIFPQYTYWKRLMCHSKLASLVIQRWKTLRGNNPSKNDDPVFGVWSDNKISAFLETSSAPLSRQLTKCQSGDWRSDGLYCAAVDLDTCNGTYAERVNDMRNAVLNRAHWMDERIEQLYKPLDAKACSGVGEIPKYNCGLNGSDDGCLKNAEKYYNAVLFPPVRKPYSGPSCDEIVKDTLDDGEEVAFEMAPYQKPSVDYCWQSAGMYVYPEQKGLKDKTLTLFCNGYGSCAEGPGAVCNCSMAVKVEKYSCRRIDNGNESKQHNFEGSTTKSIDADTQTSKQESSEEGHLSTPLTEAFAVCSAVTAVIVLLVFFGTWLVKEYRRHQRLSEFTPVRYGSIENARTIAQQNTI
ncbi:Spore coat protein CotH [Plasmopara halstedii]|uniref:Spore coat protein CotH n=1 Tax=Plasmopara halstedii TaxID=4781 RepID=A0A0P1B040_PLAHL|nr:Spore coat protein CotH [Plasmopara halstedii]CEG48093.1 Spore coat protein CotH [Plasmopara halstedii]|eukprot:XP_024584462.1 Spore coat protein CotH [Plasmopara halstedii]